MGHYDNCRPENCSECGQLNGHCEHTQDATKKTGCDKHPTISASPCPICFPGKHTQDATKKTGCDKHPTISASPCPICFPPGEAE